MKTHNQRLGELGEELAFRYLKKQGYEVLSRNWSFGRLEIDLIAKQGQTVVFVEVKTRITDDFGYPELSVKRGKQQRMAAAANAYLMELGETAFEAVRFDIIAIVKNQQEERLHHIEDAFYPMV